MKKGLIILTTVILTIAVVSGVMASEGIIKLSFLQALDTANQNDKQSLVDEYNIKAKESNLADKKEEADKQFAGGSLEQILNNEIAKEVAPMLAESDLEVAVLTKNENQRKLEAEVYKATQKVLLTKEKLVLLNNKIVLLDEQ